MAEVVFADDLQAPKDFIYGQADGSLAGWFIRVSQSTRIDGMIKDLPVVHGEVDQGSVKKAVMELAFEKERVGIKKKCLDQGYNAAIYSVNVHGYQVTSKNGPPTANYEIGYYCGQMVNSITLMTACVQMQAENRPNEYRSLPTSPGQVPYRPSAPAQTNPALQAYHFQQK